MGMTPEKVLEELKKEAEKVRALLSDVRGAQKDLQRDKKDFELAIHGARLFIIHEVDKLAGTAIKDQLDLIAKNTDRAIEVKTQQIFERFDQLECLLFMGEEGKHGKTLEELVVQFRSSAKGRKVRQLFGRITDDQED